MSEKTAGNWKVSSLMAPPLAEAAPSREDVKADLKLLLFSASAAEIRRFHQQPFWEEEGSASDHALQIESGVRLESVADHSWKVADAALAIADHFKTLDRSRCLELALLHDKLEIVMGDWSPIDAEGTGRTTHAFNREKADLKAAAERDALEELLSLSRPSLRQQQRELYEDIIHKHSDEARFVSALDKLASIIFVLKKKRNLMPRHLDFTLKYGFKAVDIFPPIRPYYDELARILIDQYAPSETGRPECGETSPSTAGVAAVSPRSLKS